MFEGAGCGPSRGVLTVDARPRVERRAPEVPMVTANGRSAIPAGSSERRTPLCHPTMLKRGRPLKAAWGPRGKGDKVGALGNQPSKGWPNSPPGAGKAAASGLDPPRATFVRCGKHGHIFPEIPATCDGSANPWLAAMAATCLPQAGGFIALVPIPKGVGKKGGGDGRRGGVRGFEGSPYARRGGCRAPEVPMVTANGGSALGPGGGRREDRKGGEGGKPMMSRVC